MSKVKTLTIEVLGPFRWSGHESDLVFKSDLILKHGIYLFATPKNGSYYIEYVGQTGKNFSKRLSEHWGSHYNGDYRIRNPKYLEKGVGEEFLYHGIYGHRGDDERLKMRKDFYSNFQKYEPIITESLARMRLFLCPIDADARTIERIEAAIADSLYSQNGYVGNVIEKGIIYRRTRPKEHQFNVEIKNRSKEKISGLSSFLEVKNTSHSIIRVNK